MPVPNFRPVVENDPINAWFAEIPISLLPPLKNPVEPVSDIKLTLGLETLPTGMFLRIVVY